MAEALLVGSTPNPPARALRAGGLEGVVVADTRLSDVDGEAGRLVVAGYAVEELSQQHSFEELCGLLWQLGSGERWGPVSRELGAARVNAHARVLGLGDALGMADPMDALRASLAHVSSGDDRDGAIAVTAAVAVYAAHASRKRRGLKLVPPDPSLGHAEDYLRMLLGEQPSPLASRALEHYLISVSEHGMNASTFAARVVASTGSDLVSSVTAALGALKGPLHGGAPGPVLDMLKQIGTPARAKDWLLSELEQGRRIMGMGHRIYRHRDPRAVVLEGSLEELAANIGSKAESPALAAAMLAKLELARKVEAVATELLAERHPARALRANVEFYTAVLLDAVGLESKDFTPTFAVGRIAGWCAHVMEQRRTGRLIRPASRYVRG